MDKYSYKDVIIDPEDPRVEIGAEYYFGSNPVLVIRYARQDSRMTKHDGVLSEVQKDSDLPFVDDDGFLFPCIIRKKESTYAERQAKWIADNDVKKGDKVRVTRKADSYEDGWDNSWTQDMDKAVGNIYTVAVIYEDDIVLGGTGDFGYPYFVLEKVEQKYVPFDLSKEEDRARLRGAWIKYKVAPRYEYQITAVHTDRIFMYRDDKTPEALLEDCLFLDGTPCGQEVEE